MDGVAILGRCDAATMKFMKEHFRKVIYTGLNPLDASWDQVICDGNAIAADAVRHLISLGHEKSAILGRPATRSAIRLTAIPWRIITLPLTKCDCQCARFF